MKIVKSFKKPLGAIASILAFVLLVVNVPLAATAAVDDVFEYGNLLCIVTAEGKDGEPGEVMVAFNENKDPEALKNISVPHDIIHGNKVYKVTALSNSAFGGCTELTLIDLSECTELKSMGMGAFYDCLKLTLITIPCNFDKTMFADTGVIPNGDKYTIEYSVYDGNEGSQPEIKQINGKFNYIHDWKPDNNNPNQHICTRCNLSGEHYYAQTAKGSMCDTCGAPNPNGDACEHKWEVLPKTIEKDTAKYECAVCQKVETQQIPASDCEATFNGQKLNTILQDPYKVLPDGTQLKTTAIEPGSARYNELLANLDDTHKVENVAFFEIELYNAKNEKISGEIAGKVRVLLQIPDGWDKKDLEAVLVMAGADAEFEESVITIDGKDYLAFWTDHFSPYAMIEKQSKKGSNKKSPATGASDYALISAFFAFATATFAFYKKRKTQ